MIFPNNTPIIIPCYNRPEFLERCLGSLSKCNNIDEFSIYFVFDKKGLDSDEGNKVLNICNSWNKCKSDLLINENVWHGSLNSTGSICLMMNKLNYSKGGFIYIEEDIIVGKDYLNFCIDALNFYKDNKHIMMISGNNFKHNKNQYNDIEFPTTCSLNQICTCAILWGMCSWWDRWQWIDEKLEEFCRDPSTIKEELFSKTILPEINEPYLRPDGTMRDYAGSRLITANMLINGSLCLYPDYSLTDHIGWYGWHVPKEFDESSEKYPFGAAESFHIDNKYNNDFPIITKECVAKSFSVDIDGIKFK